MEDYSSHRKTESEYPLTRIAVLGTLTEFNQTPLPYDMQALVDLVIALQPDLLCLDMTQEQWEQRNFDGLPAEYRAALLPLADSSDIVVVPVGSGALLQTQAAGGWRSSLIRLARVGLAFLQRTAPGPEAINSGWRHDLANYLYDFSVNLAGEQARTQRMAYIHQLAQTILRVARHDPGAHILVVVNVQFCHHIRPLLRTQQDIEVVSFKKLYV